MKRVVVLSMLIVLAACRKDEPPAPTGAQTDQLNEAESMLNDLGNEEGPEDRSPGPSNSSE